MAFFRALTASGGGGTSIEGTPLIPKMTSNTAPSGTASASSQGSSSSNYAWNAFNRSLTALIHWTPTQTGTGQWLKYEFPTATEAKFAHVCFARNGSWSADVTFKMQGTNDDSNWNDSDLSDEFSGNASSNAYVLIPFTKTGSFKYYRLYFTSQIANGSNYCGVTQLQLYN